ncbi:MAG: family hydrolase [Candidatus Saccharibacteria bacterium]|nr:family hydrolase [Candidatus Saccharibacteria bacterium]
MKNVEALISDADGTLIDTVKLIRYGQYETAKRYLTKHGIPAGEIPEYDAYDVLLAQSVGGPARETLEKTVRLLYEQSPHHLDGMDFDELHNMLNPVQDDIAQEFVTAYEGLSEMLYALGRTGIKLAISTSGTPHHVVRNFGIALPELGMSTLYRDKSKTDEEKLGMFIDTVSDTYNLPGFTIVTANDTHKHKPYPDPFELGMQRLGVTPDRVVVLGDHKIDMHTAINAGVENRIGITHGFDDRETLEAGGATRVVDSLDEMIDLLAS